MTKKSIKLLSVLVFFLPFLAFSSQKLSVQLHWKHQFQYAGFYAAIEKGYYKDLGLEIELKEWKNSINRLEDLKNNKVDFVVSASDSFGEIFKDKKLKIVASYLQKTPVALAVKPDIYFPRDLQNKKIMAVKKDLRSSIFYRVWQSSEVDLSKLNIVKHEFNMDKFIKGEVDAVQVYITDQLYELASKNVKFNIIDANSYGVDFYDSMILTSNKLALEKPQAIVDFKEATNKGWKYALENKEEIVELILKKYNTQNKSKEALLFEAKRLENFILPNLYELGNLNEEKLKKIAKVHLEMGTINSLFNIEDFIFSYKSFDRKLNLSQEEKDYIFKKDLLKICSIPNSISLDDKSFYKSIDIRLIEDITKNLNIKYEFIKTDDYEQSVAYTAEGKCDILSITRPTPKRHEILNIIQPFLAQPLVMVSNEDVLYVDDFTKLKDKTIAISHGHMAIKDINVLYPNLKIIEVESPQDGLKLVKQKKVFGFVDIPVSVAHHIKQQGYLDLKIVGNLKIIAGLSMATTKQEAILAGIIEKSMSLISEDYINTLINEWYAIKYEKGVDYTLIWQIAIGAFILLSLMFYWNQKIYRINVLLKKTRNELREKNAQLETLSVTDNLTHLYNRHKLDDVLEEEKSRCHRYGESFGIIILDIDHFKMVNDTYGHQVGDSVLKEMALILKENIRKSDTLGRWGGEEFLIICSNSDLEATKIVAEKCREAISSSSFAVVKHKTASFGVTVYDRQTDIKELITKADDNLYKAKESGRNKVVAS